MKMLKTLLLVGTAVTATATVAHDTTTGYALRGACEAASAGMSFNEKDWVLDTFPQFFDSPGEVASFLTRAWTCDRNGSDGQYYITDHVADTLNSDWFQHRKH